MDPTELTASALAGLLSAPELIPDNGAPLNNDPGLTPEDILCEGLKNIPPRPPILSNERGESNVTLSGLPKSSVGSAGELIG